MTKKSSKWVPYKNYLKSGTNLSKRARLRLRNGAWNESEEMSDGESGSERKLWYSR